ncbi:flavocytochrome c [Aerococcus kribbianus]|uniref:Urocanate reductase n=1 Tax=Aerococcus kribbianus TaxID=2999064 RepID=A0A9X3FLT3_9LACT|nr:MULTISPECIES: flavocytochrome c [unclassified Aerococcus]MCZ0716877.1 flavocytochrome c [Aerococcus sp. YH-aer221]MCZ0725165.1 flavocytochrome c [Aerococcus sp. YH-aer222]
MKIVAIVGSSNENSYNKRLLEFIGSDISTDWDYEIVSPLGFPLFTTFESIESYPELVAFSEKIRQADGVIIATGEHSRTIPPALKSLLEWLSTDVHPFNEKPVLVLGASYLDQGTSRAQLHLRQVLEAPGVNAYPLPGNEFLLGNAKTAFDEEGKIKNCNTVQFLSGILHKFSRYIQALSAMKIPEAIHYQAGTYEVTAIGHNGDLPMTVTFSDDEIIDISIDHSGETEGIANVAFQRTPEDILNGQTLDVDAVSGASVTSQGIIDGVSEAVRLAGADPNILKQRSAQTANEKDKEETFETDLVIVGAGGAGLATAASALEEGLSVTVLEKFPMIGGNTSRTGGPMNAADPDWQKKFKALPGEEASLEAILTMDLEEIHEEYRSDFLMLQDEIRTYKDDYEAGKDYLFDSILWHEIQTYLGGKRTDNQGTEVYGNYDLVKTLVSKANMAVDWLEKVVGVEFDRDHVQMPVGANWRRGHKPTKNQGYAYVEALSKYIEGLGGQIITDCKVKKLITKDGQVKGLEASKGKDKKLTITAQAVVLASGGFGANTKMLQKYNNYWERIDDDIATTNSPAITGDGIELGQAVGADLVDMGLIQMLPTSDPVTGALFTGLQVPPANFMMVNQEGKRFVNEYGSRDEISKAAIANGSLFYLIADENIKDTAMNTSQESIDKQVAEGTLYKAESLAELAKLIGVPGQVLEEEVAKYNHYVDEGYDPEFGKNVFDLKIINSPFYATPRKPAVHHTMGGLRINPKTQVLNEEGQVIPGLYAVGEVAGGIHAGNRLGGNALADIFTYGHIAGKEIARNKADKN